MGKVAITGGAGFIGSNLASRLISEGYDVVIVDDLSSGLITNIDKRVSKFEHVSITDLKRLRTALSDCGTIFHLAARGSVPRSISNPIATNDVNLLGTLNVLETARETGAHVIFSSSSSVYGRNLQLPKDESMWLGPMTPYAASKLSGESYVQAYGTSYGVPVTILRFFNVFGPRQRPDHQYAAVLPKWIWLALHDKPIEVFGDGTSTRDFTYVDTVVDVGMLAMQKRITTEGALNVAFGNRVSLSYVLDLLRDRFPLIQIQYKNSRPGDVINSQNNPILLNQMFPEVNPKPFDTAFSETLEWLIEHGQTVANGPEVKD
jgi:UDP-glucose 4-epimerase